MALHKRLLKAAALLTFTAWSATASAESWRASSVEGAATVAPAGGGGALPLRQDAEVPTGAEVRTAAGARVVLTRGGDKVTISPDSALRVERADGPGLGDRLLQALGTALFQVEKAPGRRFEVETPYLAAVVKGATFTVSVRSEGAAVHVTDGAVQVARLGGSGAPVLLRPGQTGSISSAPGSDVQVVQRQGSAAPAGPAAGEQAGEAASPGSSGGASGLALGAAIAAQPGDMLELTNGLVGNAGAPRGEAANVAAADAAGAPAKPRRVAEAVASGSARRSAGLRSTEARAVRSRPAGKRPPPAAWASEWPWGTPQAGT